MGLPVNEEQAVAFLRIQLFTAAQALKGERLAEFWALIDELQLIRPTGDPAATGERRWAKQLVQLMRTMMVDEYGWKGEDGNVAPMHYIGGRNDVLRQLCKHLEAK